MKRNGFTLVEILAVLIVISLLMALGIPAYMTVLKDARRNNYDAKIREIETAANKYGDRVKDDIKDKGASCFVTNVEKLIKMGELISESEAEDVIYNPTDNTKLLGEIRICYDTNDFDINSYYIVDEFDPNKIYYAGEKVKITINETNDIVKIYECLHDYPGDGGISGTYKVKQTNQTLPYFSELTY